MASVFDKNTYLILEPTRSLAQIQKQMKMSIYEDWQKWKIVNSFYEFQNYIVKCRKLPAIVSFCHALTTEHSEAIRSKNILSHEDVKDESLVDFSYKQLHLPTGYDAAKFLVKFCLDQNYELPVCIVHDIHRCGITNIMYALDKYNKRLKEVQSEYTHREGGMINPYDISGQMNFSNY